MRRSFSAALIVVGLVLGAVAGGSSPAGAWSARLGFAQYNCQANTLNIDISTQDETVGTEWIFKIDGSPAPGGEVNNVPYTGTPPILAPRGDYHLEVNGGDKGGHFFAAQVRRVGDVNWTTVNSITAYPGCGDDGVWGNQTSFTYDCPTDTLHVFADNKDLPVEGHFYAYLMDTDFDQVTLLSQAVAANSTASWDLKITDGDGWPDFTRGTSTEVSIERTYGGLYDSVVMAVGTISTLGCGTTTPPVSPPPTTPPVSPPPTTPPVSPPPTTPPVSPPPTTPMGQKPGKVRGLTATKKKGSLMLRWKTVEYATAYSVRVGSAKPVSVGRTQLTIPLKKVKGKNPRVQVWAVNAAGRGAPTRITL